MRKKNVKQKIYDFLKTIPKGKVVTYGQIAEYLGDRHLARYVGNVLHVNPDPIGAPCFKVVNREGRLAKHFGDGIETQKARLEADGVEVTDYRVDLEKYGWKF